MTLDLWRRPAALAVAFSLLPLGMNAGTSDDSATGGSSAAPTSTDPVDAPASETLRAARGWCT